MLVEIIPNLPEVSVEDPLLPNPDFEPQLKQYACVYGFSCVEKLDFPKGRGFYDRVFSFHSSVEESERACSKIGPFALTTGPVDQAFINNFCKDSRGLAWIKILDKDGNVAN